MKCECSTCNGTGSVRCSDCDGQGEVDSAIESIVLDSRMDNYAELAELQADARRVMLQASQLKTLKPDRAESYDAQLRASLFVINAQAAKAAKNPKTTP